MFSVACLAKREQIRFLLDVNFSRNVVAKLAIRQLSSVPHIPVEYLYTVPVVQTSNLSRPIAIIIH